MASKVNHFSFTVSDLERSVDFYVNCLGFTPPRNIVPLNGQWISQLTGMADTSMRVAFLQLDGVLLELIEYEHPKGRTALTERTCDVGSAHIALTVPRIESLTQTLLDAGAEFVSPPVRVESGPWRGQTTVYVKDWDGIVIELVEPLPMFR